MKKNNSAIYAETIANAIYEIYTLKTLN